jgi:hypothetical protein
LLHAPTLQLQLQVVVHFAHLVADLLVERLQLQRLAPAAVVAVVLLQLHHLREVAARRELQQRIANAREGRHARRLVAPQPRLGHLIGQVHQHKLLVQRELIQQEVAVA